MLKVAMVLIRLVMYALLLVALGGAIGAGVRYGMVLAIKPHSADFPLGTLCVNLVGCLLIGVLAGWLGPRAVLSERAFLFLGVGLLGGFTTFSSFGFETLTLISQQRLGAAAVYVLVSNVGGLGLAAAGMAAAARTLGPAATG